MTICSSNDPQSVADCKTAEDNINSSECNKGLTGIVTDTNNEVKIQQTTGDAVLDLDQAYTCVKIDLKTDNYEGILDKDDTKMIPLKGVSSFDSIRIDWFNGEDLQADSTIVNVPDFAQGIPLIANTAWVSATEPNRPPVLRARLIQYANSGFLLSDFDGNGNTSGNSNTNTIFLYPSSIAKSSLILSTDRRTPSEPTSVHCDSSIIPGGYACSSTILLPNPIGGNESDRTAYLDLSSLYRNTNYQITLLSSNAVVQFDSVEPLVDSTGRANDLFRRVRSRIETVSGIYPMAEISVSGNLCKKFAVTDVEADYDAYDCAP
jgi:hypothetical protein